MIKNCAPKGEEKWTYHYDFLKYHSLLSTGFVKDNWKYIDNQHSLYTRGFCPNEGIQEILYTDMSGVEEVTVLNESVDNILKSLLVYCNDNNLRVLFIVHSYQITEEDQKNIIIWRT